MLVMWLVEAVFGSGLNAAYLAKQMSRSKAWTGGIITHVYWVRFQSL